MRVKKKPLLYNEHLDLDGNKIHILSVEPADFEVWLNTEAGDFDGLCIGCGRSREAAIADAIRVLDGGLQALRRKQ